MSVTNHAFADKVGCNYTMASRMRSGQRRPSAEMLSRICRAYNLDEGEALRTWAQGAETFSAWLREKVFDQPDEPEDKDAATVAA